MIRQVGEAGLFNQQCAQRGTQHEGLVQAIVAVRQALHIPAMSFDEPNCETGNNIWWRFQRAGGARWALAGLWNIWTDQATGEMVESYMLTLNADAYPLMSHMHKPDPQLGPDAQDKRSVVPIEFEDVDAWLHGTPEHAQALVRLAPVEVFDAGSVGR